MGAAATDSAEERLIHSDKDACVECWGCVRYCPAKAIRVVDRRSEVIPEKCVACGLCVYDCGHSGHVVRDDTGKVWDLLASGRPVVAVLASEFVAAMHPMRPPDVERALERMGFYAVESTVLGEEMLAIAYTSLCGRKASFPALRSTCPVTAEWVRRYHPSLVQALAPLVPPYIAQARLVRELYPADTAVVYVSPCYSRKDEIRDPELAGAVDVAIDFSELKRMMESGQRAVSAGPPSDVCGARRPFPIKELSLTDGFPRDVLASRSAVDNDVVVVRGLRELDGALRAIEQGESAPVIVDMLMCEGCIDGPTVNPGIPVAAKRNIESAERQMHPRSAVSSRVLLRHLPDVDLVRSFQPRPVVVPMPSSAEVDAILAEGGFASRAETLDCGACGYRTCVEHAVAVYQANSSWDMCFPLQRRLLETEVSRLEEDRTLDELTGLWSRRVFAERLVDEVARFDRYGTPVSLLVLKLDASAELSERLGEGIDQVVAAVGSHLRSILRMTDLPARYDGERFAVLMPNITKTQAFAAAEKVRMSLEAFGPEVEGDGYRVPVDVTVSIGVAAAGASCTEAALLLEAADGALASAEELGGNQVRLA